MKYITINERNGKKNKYEVKEGNWIVEGNI